VVEPGSQEWLDQVEEPIVEPGRRVVDPHHHLWPPGGSMPYGVDQLVADTTSGHNVVSTVFVECRAAYRADGPEHLRPVGETAFVAESAADLSRRHPSAPPIAGIVAHADLTLGAPLGETLDAHRDAAGGLFRGIRHSTSHAVEPEALTIAGRAPEALAADPAFRSGVRLLGERGLTYDTWQYHYQLPELVDLARIAPETVIVLDHFSTPVGVGRFAGRRDEIFDEWSIGIRDLAGCPNVVAKIGGLAMPDNGFGWHTAQRPATSDELVEAQGRYYRHMIESFGPGRCMFESNFPVDRLSISYPVLWNALKKIASEYSDDEQDVMFSGTATRVYRL
jgi:predicted TIM-barrel fold metal-dependent hydrolase